MKSSSEMHLNLKTEEVIVIRDLTTDELERVSGGSANDAEVEYEQVQLVRQDGTTGTGTRVTYNHGGSGGSGGGGGTWSSWGDPWAGSVPNGNSFDGAWAQQVHDNNSKLGHVNELYEELELTEEEKNYFDSNPSPNYYLDHDTLHCVNDANRLADGLADAPLPPLPWIILETWEKIVPDSDHCRADDGFRIE